jgi:hypothetical protein
MAKLGSLNFYVSSVSVDGYSGASDFNTDSTDLSDYQEGWIVYAESTHTSGTPTITIQVSRDGINWLNYCAETVNVAPPVAIKQSYFYPKYIRIAYTANSSDGNITLKFDKIND